MEDAYRAGLAATSHIAPDAALNEEVLTLRSALSAHHGENATLRLRIGQLEEALRLSGAAAIQVEGEPVALDLQGMCILKADLLAAKDCTTMEEIDILASKIACQFNRPTDDALWDKTLSDRDNYHDWADRLSEAIAEHFNAEIGEHSNMNNPWAEALEVIQFYSPPTTPEASELPEPLGYMSPGDIEHIESRTAQYRGRNCNIKATVFLDHGHSDGSATEPVFTAKQVRAAIAMHRAAAEPVPTAAPVLAGGLTHAEIEDIIKAINAAMNPAAGMFFPRGWNVILNKLAAFPVTKPAASEAVGELVDSQLDEAAADAIDRVAKARGLHTVDVNTNIAESWALRRELVRAGLRLAANAGAAPVAKLMRCKDCHDAWPDDNFDCPKCFGHLAAPAAPTDAKSLPVELQGVQEQKDAGFWHSCSGCHETEDGHPVGLYAYSHALGCALGSGCSECGGIGARWDNNDYSEEAHAEVDAAAPTDAGVREATACEVIAALESALERQQRAHFTGTTKIGISTAIDVVRALKSSPQAPKTEGGAT